MKNKKTLLITTIVCLLPILMGLAFYDQLPDQVATHFNSNGVADGYSPKAFAVFGLPAFLAVVNIIVHLAVDNDPKRDNVSKGINIISKWIAPVVSLLINPVMYLIALGKDLPIVMITSMFIGVLFIILGAYLPKCEQNYTIGIKLPWTLADAENWEKTHRLSGYLWIAGGIAVLIAAFFEWSWIFAVVLPVMVLIPMIYSFVLYKKRNN